MYVDRSSGKAAIAGLKPAPESQVVSQLYIWSGFMNRSSAGEASGTPVLNWLWADIRRHTAQEHERGYCVSVVSISLDIL